MPWSNAKEVPRYNLKLLKKRCFFCSRMYFWSGRLIHDFALFTRGCPVWKRSSERNARFAWIERSWLLFWTTPRLNNPQIWNFLDQKLDRRSLERASVWAHACWNYRWGQYVIPDNANKVTSKLFWWSSVLLHRCTLLFR
jgi:hypothetical protein